MYAVLGAGASVVIVFLAAVAYAIFRVMTPPANAPAVHLNGPESRLPAVVCIGDSITHGHIGADWVSPLRTRLRARVDVINAGVNGELAWNVLQRLDTILACKPKLVTVLIGTNDAMGSENQERGRYYVKGHGLPQLPQVSLYAAHLDELVERLVGAGVRVALLTLPPLGDDDDAGIAAVVLEHNEVIRRVAATHDVELLEIHSALRTALPVLANAPAYRVAPLPARVFMVGAGVAHYVLGRSWDHIASARGLSATVDCIHLSDRAAAVVGALVGEFVERALEGSQNQT